MEDDLSLLSQGWQLFHYIARCQDKYVESMDMIKEYINTFNQDTAGTILEAASVINNVDRKLKEGRHIWEKSSAGKLMEKINEIFGLNIYKLEVLSSTSDNVKDIRDEEIRKLLNICMEEEECNELNMLVTEFGEHSVEYQ